MKILATVIYTLIVWWGLNQLVNWLFLGMLTKLFPAITDQHVLGVTLGVAAVSCISAAIWGKPSVSISFEKDA